MVSTDTDERSSVGYIHLTQLQPKNRRTVCVTLIWVKCILI